MLPHISNRSKADNEKRGITIGDNIHLMCVAMKGKGPSVVKAKT